jgi:dihydroorotate dehydrogenase electron transfer subunit
MIKKYVKDLTVRTVERISDKHLLIRLTDAEPLPQMEPGQFVEVRIDASPTTFLRRPISINFVDRENNVLWLLVAMVGDGTRRLQTLKPGDTLNCVLPLGTGFAPADPLKDKQSFLLVGGGVGIAPLLYQGYVLKNWYESIDVTFLLGARSANDLLLLNEFEKYGRVLVTTEDGTMGEKGFVTNHSVLQQEHFDMIQCCGPTPMMKAVVSYAWKTNTECQVSLENMMACGLGACLCCVEKIRQRDADQSEHVRNVCVCKDGPVFNKEELLWQS